MNFCELFRHHLIFSVSCIILFNSFHVESEILTCKEKTFLEEIVNGSPMKENTVINLVGQNLNSTECTTWEYGHGLTNERCENQSFSLMSTGYFSNVRFFPRLLKCSFPFNLNISFSEIEWQFMKLRLIVDGRSFYCMDFEVNKTFERNAELFIARCDWLEGSTAEVEVQVYEGDHTSTPKGYAHFLFLIQRDFIQKIENLIDVVTMVAMEVSQAPYISVVWPHVTGFNVTAYFVEMEGSDRERVLASSCERGFCRWTKFAGYQSRIVKIMVKPDHPDCPKNECVWQTPIYHLKMNVPWYFWLLSVIFAVLVIFLIVFTIYYFCCGVPTVSPKVLYLFDAVDLQHTRASRILAEYLKDVANIECLYEVQEVPRSESKNASKWLQDTLESSPSILVVASPPSHSPIRYSAYPNVFAEALPLIEKCVRCSAHMSRSRRILVALPPYLNKLDLPKELRGLRLFHVPSQLDFLTWSLYNPHLDIAPISFLVWTWLRLIGCPGPTSAYRRSKDQNLRRLKEAYTAASAALVLQEQLPTPPDSPRTFHPQFPGSGITSGDNTSAIDREKAKNGFGDIGRLPLLGSRGNPSDAFSLPDSLVSETNEGPHLDLQSFSLGPQGPV